MDIVQLGSLVGGFVVLVGLLRVHRYVVRTHVIPSIEDEDATEE